LQVLTELLVGVLERQDNMNWFYQPLLPVAADDFKPGRVQLYISGAWVHKPAKVWMGSSWIEKPIKYWNGTSWVVCNQIE